MTGPSGTAVGRYRAAVTAFGDLVRAVRSDQWNRSSPCPGWTARDVLDHVIGGQEVLLSLLQNTTDAGPAGLTHPAEDADLRSRWETVEALVLAALDDPSLPERRVVGPAGALDGSALLEMCLVEPLVHRWDLAKAVGADATVDDTLAACCLTVARRYDDMLRPPGMYGPARKAPDGACAGTALLVYLGRLG